MTTVYEGRKLAEDLVDPAKAARIDLLKVAETLRSLSDGLDATLKVANDLSQSMDSVHLDRVKLAALVEGLTAERDHYKSLIVTPGPATAESAQEVAQVTESA